MSIYPLPEEIMSKNQIFSLKNINEIKGIIKVKSRLMLFMQKINLRFVKHIKTVMRGL